MLMLDDFLLTNRAIIITRAGAMVARRGAPRLGAAEQAANGVPAFLDQLVAALRLAKATDVSDNAQLAKSGAAHGRDLLASGLTIAEVVREYGDVCQTVTEMVIEQDAEIAPSEFKTLNLCLDEATAEAVSAYAHQNALASADEGTERLGVLAHEMRNHLNTAMLALASIQGGRVGGGGSTGAVLNRSLLGIRDLIDRALAAVRLDAGIQRLEPISAADLVAEVEVGASMQGNARGIGLVVGQVDRAICVRGDRPILAAALANLLQNAFKFTSKGGRVSLTTTVAGDRVRFAVEDECGGLPVGAAEDLFRPYSQGGDDRSGVGLGLVICRRAAESSGGSIGVRDLPGKGCVFTLELPLHVAATT